MDSDNYCFDPVSEMKTNVVLDFMSKIRQYPDLANFGQLIKTSFGAAKHICEPEYIHLVFDSYFELSVKDGERARRTEDGGHG